MFLLITLPQNMYAYCTKNRSKFCPWKKKMVKSTVKRLFFAISYLTTIIHVKYFQYILIKLERFNVNFTILASVIILYVMHLYINNSIFLIGHVIISIVL